MKQTLLKLSRTWKCSAYRYIATFINIIKLSALRARSPVSSLCREASHSFSPAEFALKLPAACLFFPPPQCHLPQTCNRALLEYLLRISFPLRPCFYLTIPIFLRHARFTRTFNFTRAYSWFTVDSLFSFRWPSCFWMREDISPLLALSPISFDDSKFYFAFYIYIYI